MMLLSNLSPLTSLRELARERDVMEVLRGRASLLAGEERALLTMYLESGSSVCQIARLTGLRRSTVSRRIRKVIARLCDETYLVCVRQRGRFTERELTLIKDHFVRGLSARRIACSRRVSLYRVRLTLHKARQLLAEQGATPDDELGAGDGTSQETYRQGE
jgi:DNA-directed RNA polymerase specialized sigma24 family protein